MAIPDVIADVIAYLSFNCNGLKGKRKCHLLRKLGLQATQMVFRGLVLLRLGDLLLYLRYLVQDPHNEAGGRGASTIDRK